MENHAVRPWAMTSGVDTAVMAIASMMTAVMPSASVSGRRWRALAP
jgi:hypothetical protein